NLEKYQTKAFELYRLGIQHDILANSPVFVEAHFMNIIGIGVVLKEFAWLDHVLNEKLITCLSQISTSAYHIGFARYSLAKKTFAQCREHLIAIDYTKPGYAIKAKSYNLICCYELAEPIAIIEANCKSFENYLRRNKTFHHSLLQHHLIFINLIRQLIRPDTQKQRLLQKLNSSSVAYRPWLLEKINMLK
ncbi:MAG: hypothetical protein AAGJ18_18360, partial [Bacteroidota bacterium]